MKLPRHPFAMRGRIEQCWIFVHRTLAENVRGLLPDTLSPITHGGFAFWNIVVCRLSGMRPPPFPASVGLGYWHVAYRLHVRASSRSLADLAGLYFIRSDCDRRLVATAGNLLTDFHFRRTEISVHARGPAVEGRVAAADGTATFRIDRAATPQLADGSPFNSLEEAAEALEYPPRALSPDSGDALWVVHVRRDPAAWRWRNVVVTEERWPFFVGRETAPELCYEVEPIEYHWERGHRLHLEPCAS